MMDPMLGNMDIGSNRIRNTDHWRNPNKAEMAELLREGRTANALIVNEVRHLIVWPEASGSHAEISERYPDWNGLCLRLTEDSVILDAFEESFWDEKGGDLACGLRPYIPHAISAIRYTPCLEKLYGNFTVVGANKIRGEQYDLTPEFFRKHVCEEPRGLRKNLFLRS